jgi:hypothetical protein
MAWDSPMWLGVPGRIGRPRNQRGSEIRRVALIVMASVLLLSAAADADAAASTVWFEGAVTGYGHVKPSNVPLSADGTLWASHVKWSAWGGRVAVGRGLGEEHGCTPSCGQAPIQTARVRVKLYDVVQCGTEAYYDKATLYRLNGRVFARSRFNWVPCEAA